MIINAEEARSAARDYKKREYKAMRNDMDILINALMDNQEFVKYAVAILEKPINKNIELLSSVGMFQASYYPKFLSHKTDNGMINYICLDKLEKRLLRLVRTDLRIAGYKVDDTNIYW